MPRLGFELTIPVFQRAEIFHALDRADIMIGIFLYRAVELLPITPVVILERKF
jgi:hypothetical protein